MRLSQSLLRSAILLAAVVAAGCDRDVNSVMDPAKVPSGPNALIVHTGYSHVSVGASDYGCAIRTADGGLVCWGSNEHTQTSPPPGAYTQLSAGLVHACARRADAAIVCWGSTADYQNVVPAGSYTQVGAGDTFACGVRAGTGVVVCWGANSKGEANAPAGAYVQLSVGVLHSCALNATGQMACWGWNTRGQANVPPGTYTQVSAGNLHTCALRTNGTLACWGSNDYGQSVPPAGFYTQVSAGDFFSCAIRTADRGIVCWGFDLQGPLTPPAGAYTEVSTEGGNACAIRAGDGVIVCWGNNYYGQSSPPGIATVHAPPSASFTVPASVVALDTFALNLNSARVNGYPQATSFTYRFDCGDGTGYGAAQAASYTRCPTRVAGNRTVRGKVIDQDGDTASYSLPLVVKLRPQTVTFTSTAPTSAVMRTTTSTTTYTASATATSGRAVTVTAASGTVCTASGNVVTFVGMGRCTIAADQAGDSTWAAARATQTVKVIWPFTGFYTPVYNAPSVNVVSAGRYVKIPFSLSGNRGIGSDVVPSNTASSYVVTCDPNAPRVNIMSFGVSTTGVVYDVNSARYVLTWKPDPSWAGTCRTVVVTLADGTTHTLKFAFN